MRFNSSKPADSSPKISRKQLIMYMLIFVIIPILTYTGGRCFDQIYGLPIFPPFPWNLIFGFIVFSTGLAIGIKATRQLYHEGLGLPWGEIKNEVRSKRLVKTGLYAYTRNPMILGYSLLPNGMGLMFQSLSMTIIVPIIVLIINLMIVKYREESTLKERFGEDYTNYMKSTPLLIPRDFICFLRSIIWD